MSKEDFGVYETKQVEIDFSRDTSTKSGPHLPSEGDEASMSFMDLDRDAQEFLNARALLV